MAATAMDRDSLRGPDDAIIRHLYKVVMKLATLSEDEDVQDIKTEMEAEFPWLSQS